MVTVIIRASVIQKIDHETIGCRNFEPRLPYSKANFDIPNTIIHDGGNK